jgi:hypothetical protein
MRPELARAQAAELCIMVGLEDGCGGESGIVEVNVIVEEWSPGSEVKGK